MRQDPVQAPLRVLAAGLAATIATVLLGAIVFFLIERDAPVAPFPNLISALSVVSDVMVLVACIMLWKAKRPGHALALASGICHAVDILFTGGWVILGLLSASSVVYTALSLVNTIVDIASMVLLAVSLRELARGRGRDFDAWLVGTAVVSGLAILGRIADFMVSFSFALYLLTSAISIATRVVLLVVALLLARTTVLPDPQLAYDSAYRGPTGAIAPAVEGSLALGFLAGLFGGCIGALLVLVLAKGAQTKRGAGIGFACQIVVGIGLRAAIH